MFIFSLHHFAGFTDREKIVNIGGGDIKLQLWYVTTM